MAIWDPDRYFARITRINVERDLLACGLRFVLLDVDNTILTRDTREIPRDVGLWLGAARDAGLSLCLLSNNWHDEVHALAQEIDLPLVSKAMKPLPPGYIAALRKVGGVREQTVVVGDQLGTDVVGAHVVGMKAFLVAPLVEHDLAHMVLLRKVERALLGERVPEGAMGAFSEEAVGGSSALR